MKTPSYRAVPFTSRPSPERHIDRLLLIGRFFGLETAASSFRVLELGSGTGATLLAQAPAYPGCSFRGVDSDEEVVAAAEESRVRCGFGNLAFERQDLSALQSPEQFDLIICHGVYSWVEPDVRARILPLISSLLSPCGVAYVSFNARPGWDLRGKLRDYLISLNRENDPVAVRVATARAALHRLANSDSLPEPEQREAALCLQSGDGLIAHELLNVFSSAEPLADFTSCSRECGLSYLGDARHYRLCLDSGMAAKSDTLAAVQTRSESITRPLHCAVLCRTDAMPQPKPLYALVDSLCVSSPFVHDPSGRDLRAEGKEIFRSPAGAPVYAAEEDAQLLEHLSCAWPTPVVTPGRISRDALCALFFKGVIDLHTTSLGLAHGIPQQPAVSPFARLQLSKAEIVTTLRHEYAIFGAIERAFTQALDGTRDRSMLGALVRGWIDDGTIAANQPPGREEESVLLADQLVQELLERARESALLLER